MNLYNICVQNFLKNLIVKKIINWSVCVKVMIKSQVYWFFCDTVYNCCDASEGQSSCEKINSVLQSFCHNTKVNQRLWCYLLPK